MKIESLNTNLAILQEFGRRAKQARLIQNRSQRYLADEAGVALNTVIRLESGGSISLDNLLRILRVLRLIERFDFLIPERFSDPVQEIRRQPKLRQRARVPRPEKTQ
jgi:putative transcriptional regulator